MSPCVIVLNSPKITYKHTQRERQTKKRGVSQRLICVQLHEEIEANQMMPNRSLCWMYSSYLYSVSFHTPRRTLLLLPPHFHLSFLLSHLINLLSFLFTFFTTSLSPPFSLYCPFNPPPLYLPGAPTGIHTHSRTHSFCSSAVAAYKS